MCIHKRDSKEDNTNYRQIFSIEALSSCMESIMNQQILKYMLENEIIPNQQFAFITGEGVGTIGCFISAIIQWLVNIVKGNYTVITSFDLAAAFPTLSTPLAMKKMKIYGLDDNSLKWFESYLNYRIVTTKVGNSMSNEIRKTHQLSEGSQLSSTLFLIQIADINRYFKYSTSNSFTDDQCHSNEHANLEIALQQAQIDANATVDYFKMNEFAAQ